jgi:hypothetical protein
MSVDRVYVSWTEQWDLQRYVEHYARSRSHAPGHEVRLAILRYIEHYPGDPPFTKSSLDYFLDANFGRRK